MMQTIREHDEFGDIAIPDDNYCRTALWKGVCGGDEYKFRRYHDEQFQVDLAIDLGASIGVASRMIHHFWPKAKIIAFEPDPNRFQYLVINCPTVECRQIAVAGYAYDFDRMVSNIATDKKWRPDATEALKAVPGLKQSVKEAFAGIEKIDLLKIDVEGFEMGILKEMHDLGLIQKTRLIVGEWHFSGAKQAVIDTMQTTHVIEFDSQSPNPWDVFKSRLIE